MGTYTLVGPDGRPYPSQEPGTLGGHRGARLYGRLDCPSALRALARGGYAGQRVFFADAATARAAGYRPCAVCLPEEYAAWRSGEDGGAWEAEADAARRDGRAVPARPDRRTAPAAELAAELVAVLALVRASGARAVAIGHGRDGGSAAEAFATIWGGALDDAGRGGTVLAVVEWPERAASWLRQARRFTAGEPDAWVVAGAARGWAGMAERLRRSTAWDPRRTFGFAGVAGAVALAPPGTVEGMRGATVDGAVWRAGRALIHLDPSPAGH